MKEKKDNKQFSAKTFALTILALAILVAFASVASADQGNKTMQALSIRYSDITCKVNFTNTQINLFNTYIPSVSFGNDSAELTADLSLLQTYSQSGDQKSFDSYQSASFRQDLQQATKDLNTAKENFRSYNLTNDTKTAFIEGLKSARDSYVSCIKQSQAQMAGFYVSDQEETITNWEDIISSMNNRSLDTSKMSETLSELQSHILELQSQINSSNYTEQLDALRNFHQTNLHVWARFEIARLDAYANKVAPIATQYNLSSQINDIEDQLNNASQTAVDGNKYTPEDFYNVWNNIKTASASLHNTALEINQVRRQEMEQQREQRKEQIQQERHARQQNRSNNSDDGNTGINVSGEANGNTGTTDVNAIASGNVTAGGN